MSTNTCTMYNIQCTLYTVHCTVYSVDCTSYTMYVVHILDHTYTHIHKLNIRVINCCTISTAGEYICYSSHILHSCTMYILYIACVRDEGDVEVKPLHLNTTLPDVSSL